MKNFEVRLVYFQRNKDAWIECKVIFHLQADNVHGALIRAVNKLDGVTLNNIEDVRIEKEL